jgi:4-hydroxyacetophenone monooxygenase
MNRVDIEPADLGRADLERAVRSANVPTLVMVLFQLTGDRKWLGAPYAPSRAPGLSSHDSGGLPPGVQDEIRAAAVEAVLAWTAGKPPALAAPSPAVAHAMAQVCVGEPVPSLYGEQVAAMLAEPETASPLPPNDFSVVIIGAGISGLAAAFALRQAGVKVVVFEQNDRPGGVWADNCYPGAGVDTPSYVYSFSFFRHPWSTHFGKRDEVLAYLEDMVTRTGLADVITFGTKVTAAQWDAASARWRIRTQERSGATGDITANAVITAVGLLSRPVRPDLPGMDAFAGQLFHSAQWPAGLDVRGKRVAVVGSGASAMQIVPAIADQVAGLTIFQRSPQWAAPDEDYFGQVPADAHWLIEHVPFYHFWYWFRLNWTFGDRNYPAMNIDPDWPHPARAVNEVNDRHRAGLTRYIEGQLAGRDDLIAASVPAYPPYGKRILLDNGWYATLRRENVALVSEPVTAFTPDGPADASGRVWPADIVVMCTGFDPQRPVYPIEVTGRDGVTLGSVWGQDDPRAYLGVTAPHFPNLFFLYGPNTNPGGGAVISVVEQQVRYVVTLIEAMITGGLASIEPRQDRHDEYNERVDAEHARRIWSHPGMTTYYRNAAGRVVVNMPWQLVQYWRLLREPSLGDFEVTRA